MKKPAPFILSLLAAGTVLAGDPFSGPDANQSGLADGVRLSARVVENVYLMPEQITKLIFPKAVEEVSVNTQVITIGRNGKDGAIWPGRGRCASSWAIPSVSSGSGELDAGTSAGRSSSGNR